MSESIDNIDPQFRLDAEVAPVYKCTNYNSEEKTFDVYYNDSIILHNNHFV